MLAPLFDRMSVIHQLTVRPWHSVNDLMVTQRKKRASFIVELPARASLMKSPALAGTMG
ncbi:hypothetical protein PFWH6_0648 [Pseudomonas fluorescens WH6]|nr:hypothetical protein PFWH6_0648 [Pseudomonas fluorescens WH6]